jgi:hypothetical protein
LSAAIANCACAPAQGDVVQRHLGGDRNLYVAQTRAACPDGCIAGVERALVGTEDVEFPGGIETGPEIVHRRVAAGLAALCQGQAVEPWPQGGRRDIAQRPRLQQCRLCASDAVVRRQCLDDQAAQQRIVETQPPRCQRRRVAGNGGVAGRPGRGDHERHLVSVLLR